VGTTEAGSAICYCLHDGFPEAPYSDTCDVNPRGTVALCSEEAFLLAPTGEPEGFVPYASEAIWRPSSPPLQESLHVSAPAVATADVDPPDLWAGISDSALNEMLDTMEARMEQESNRAPSPATEDDEPCTFGLQRGICRCCGELTIEPDEAAY